MLKSVRGRLSAAFGSMVVLVAVVAFVGAKGMEDGRSDYLGYVEGTSQRIDALGDVLEAADARAIAARNLVLLTDAREAEVEKAAVQAAHRKMNAAIERLGMLMGAAAPLPEAQSAQFAKVVEAERRYGPVALAIVELAAGGRRADAIGRINSECRPLLATLIAEVDRLVQMSHEAARESAARADQRHAFDRNLMIAGVLAAFVAGGLLAVAITRSVLGTLGAEPVALNAAVSRLAAGDLVTEIVLQPGDRHSTLAAVRRMQASLAAIVTTVRGNSDSVATASAQIAQGNLHLSQRTEEQASACQQTSATMDELSATVSHNAHNAAEASRLAQGASELAQRGGEVVGQVVETMRDIERSSSKISEITGVIDGIAFQTNLLALNAAVEAARAGEQGRGFGVVASEVRTLARRSADAAREIKALITGSVEQVGRGGRLVDDAGRRMAEIVGAIQGVNAVVTEISTATAEQSTGVEQVGQAIGQIDQVTQQNSALVEEASAAADSLKEQARQLVQTVATFQV